MAWRTWKGRVVWWVLAAATITLVVLVAGSFWLLNSRILKTRAEQGLTARLGLPVTINELKISFFPRPRIVGSGLVVTMPSAPAQPFVAIDRFSAEIGPLSVWRGYVKAVLLDGLRIVVPPGADAHLNAAALPDGPDQTIAGLLEAREAALTFLRRDPGKEPLQFKIHRLAIRDVGFGRVMPFTTSLINPVPEGLVESTGTIGPWNRQNPLALPVAGDYQFSLANLDKIRGIGGTLTASGKYAGHLDQIVVTGSTTTPDFSLDLGGRPVPLTATFAATVDASDGSTRLDRVDAKLFSTPVTVNGMIANLPGPGNRHLDLDARVERGRIEDVLRLVVDRTTPALAGAVSVTAHIVIPPGNKPVKQRMQMRGTFDLDRAEFTSSSVRDRLLALSRRSQGKDVTDAGPDALSSVAGRFAMTDAVIALDRLTFEVPGAAIRLRGSFASESGALDLSGELRMQASMSNAVGGVKSIFLKPFDWVFRRDGAGAVVPIEISGTYKNPAIGVNIRRVFTRGGVYAPS